MINSIGNVTNSPTTQRPTDLQTCEKYCVFEVGTSTLGVLATAVREVALRPQIAAVPDANHLLAGLCHLRNEFLPVVNLLDLDVASKSQSGGQQVIVITAGNGPWALLVDRVIGLVPLEVSLSSEAGTALGWTSSVMGSASHDDRIVQVLDANSLFRYFDDALSVFWRAQVTT
ncbi:MAG: chemotaxis protein CheW [Pirellulaceae bacterium]|nr:chemotaxis protein CheW [Pirellulaceae bacterium]